MSVCPFFCTQKTTTQNTNKQKFPQNPQSWILSGAHCQNCDTSQSSLYAKNATVVNEQISATVLSKRTARADMETVLCWI